MIHWDWVFTAAVMTPVVVLVFLGVAGTVEAVADALDERRTKRAIERQRLECLEARRIYR